VGAQAAICWEYQKQMSYIDLVEGNLRQLEITSHGDTVDIRQKGDGPVVITSLDGTSGVITVVIIEGTDLTKLRLWLNEGVD
jgi:hypothetical protein